MRLSRILIAALLLSGLVRAELSPLITLEVQGEVGIPGKVQIDGQERWPLARALARAGGLNEGAAWERIQIRRGGQGFTVGRYSELPLEDGDVISVQRLRAIVVRSMQAPQKIDLSHRSLSGLLGAQLADYRGMVVHTTRESTGQQWNHAEFFDGSAKNRVELEDDDVIILSKRSVGKPIRVTLTGEVRKPGETACSAGSSLLDALTISEGFEPNADAERVILIRQGRERLIPDLLSLSTMELQANDVLKVVPVTELEITVGGEVGRRGRYLVPLDSRDQLGEAVKAAGGVLEGAATHRIRVWRPGENRCVFLADLDNGSTELKNGDFLWVDAKRCRIAGSASSAGEYFLQGGDTLTTVIREIGVDISKHNRVRLLRASDLKSKNYRWESYKFSEPEAIAKVKVDDGDYIFFPPAENENALPTFFPLELFEGRPIPSVR